MLSPKSLQSLRRLFDAKSFKNDLKYVRVFCSQPRFKIMVALCRCGSGLTVSEIAEILEAPISRISHQLAILRKLGFVRRRRRNRERIYTLDMKRVTRAHDSLHALTYKPAKRK